MPWNILEPINGKVIRRKRHEFCLKKLCFDTEYMQGFGKDYIGYKPILAPNYYYQIFRKTLV